MSENNRYGSIAAVATHPTCAGVPCKVTAVTSGNAIAATWLPKLLTLCPNQYYAKLRSSRTSLAIGSLTATA
ncbi:hypothetical protein GCM10027030_12880 [Luteococcus sediminum]